MNGVDLGNNPNASSNIHEKRKRGRPRKLPRLDLENIHQPNTTQHLNLGENAGIGSPPLPPGFDGRNGYQPHHAAPVNGTTDPMVGAVVSGVIDGTFDGGYLLSLRVGNSLSTLRGVVFKPGRYVPVTAENDVAPDLQMTRRNAIPIPVDVYSHGHGKRWSRNVIRASKRQQVPPVAGQTVNPLLSRGNLSPVILQPRTLTERVPPTGISASVAQVVSLPNGSTHPNHVSPTSEPTSMATQVADAATPKVTQVTSGATPSNGSIVPNVQIPATLVSERGRNEKGTLNQPSTGTLVWTEAKTMRLPDMPFENLVNEVVKRMDSPSQAPPQSTEIHIEGSKSTIDELESGEVQPLVIEPLQAFLPIVRCRTPSKSPEDGRNGKMSELLQAVQESMAGSEVPQAEVSIARSSLKLDEAS